MQPIVGRFAFLSLLEDEGIDILFGNPGSTELPIMAALRDHPDLQCVLGLPESIVVAMADGYSRASNRLPAANVHVAPGLGNAMGSLFNAKWYGSPTILTAGQHEQGRSLHGSAHRFRPAGAIHGCERAAGYRTRCDQCRAPSGLSNKRPNLSGSRRSRWI